VVEHAVTTVVEPVAPTVEGVVKTDTGHPS
jgi:hypothetical protein